jgi:subtilisin
LSVAGEAQDQSPEMNVLDSIHEDGAKLIETSAEGIAALRAIEPGLRAVPVVQYGIARAPRHRVRAQAAGTAVAAAAAGAAPRAVVVTVTEAGTGTAISNAQVVAFTDFDAKTGDEARTDAAGSCSLRVGPGAVIQRLYVYPKAIHWGALRIAVATDARISVELAPVTLTQPDALLHYFPAPGPENAGDGVTVGVIDTGIDLRHPDLTVAQGENTVVNESPMDYDDNGEGHGTHVAGIIAGRTPRGVANRSLGLAPKATLHSYRPFPIRQPNATNYSIAKAIDRAVANRCDIINLSLASPTSDDAIAAAIDDAYHAGTLVVAAAGNDGRKPVAYPAALNFVIAVSALGRQNTFPPTTVDAGEVADPYGADQDDFIALFSNFGDPIDLTAPGVGIISTVPVASWGAMSGTSMSAPVITGYAARLLSEEKKILAMPRDASRADAMIKAVLAMARPLGFTPQFEGRGLPR